MEKKGNRILQPLRGQATDTKKNQDGVGGKVWPRGGHRREPTLSTSSTKPDPSRKPQPQRWKTLDKRPKQRGGSNSNSNFPTTANSGTVARTSTTRLNVEQEAELGSIFLPGSKKQSLNHLLNFVYSPREGLQHTDERVHNKGLTKLLETKKHKYNKEHFLQANCQFVVNDGGDYKQYLTNPDALVDWNLIEQVNVQVSEFPSCPICLYPPVAAKMTRCGHIYCWSCVLHYLALSDKTWRKCPICYEAVHKKDLKSVIAIHHATFNVTETITFKLMKRARGSLTAYPAEAVIKADDVIFNMSRSEVDEIYSKLLLANTNEVLTIIEREKQELLKQLIDDGDCFVDQALDLLKHREEKVLDVKNIEENIVQLNLVDSDSQKDQKFHYFYQASDGQHIYLHAINARMIEYTYGSLEFGPKTITGKILEKEGGSMTEELRKRLRYLQHLPVTCQFEVAEIQLKQPLVNKETIEFFQDQIDIRRKIRQRRAKEEKRREKRIAEEENRQMGKFKTPDLHLESHQQFPDFGSEPRLRSESECTQPSERSSSPDLFGHEISGPSFATMLASQKKVASPSWPDLKSSPIPVKLINVTGAKMNSSTAVMRNRGNDSDDDFEPVPVFSKSFGDAIAEALQQAEKAEEEVVGCSGGGGKRKKKKSKQKVLFTTNMAYSG